MAEPLLTAEEISTRLRKVPEWELNRKVISRVFEFDTFDDAVDFVNDVAEVASDLDHHPEIRINYDKVTLTATTHDAGGLTALDFQLAARVDNLTE